MFKKTHMMFKQIKTYSVSTKIHKIWRCKTLQTQLKSPNNRPPWGPQSMKRPWVVVVIGEPEKLRGNNVGTWEKLEKFEILRNQKTNCKDINIWDSSSIFLKDKRYRHLVSLRDLVTLRVYIYWNNKWRGQFVMEPKPMDRLHLSINDHVQLRNHVETWTTDLHTVK